jgi:16S rRNA (uracil1498-N3)-methyltransferase
VSGGAAVLELLEPLDGSQWVLPVDLAPAAVRPSRMEWLVEKASELGARSLRPLLTERTTSRPGPGRLARWERVALAAAKQCGRGAPMAIAPAVSLVDLMQCPESRAGLVLDPSGRPLSELPVGAGRVLLATGPEGGFSPRELEAVEAAGWRRAALPAAVTLRSETAAIAALVLVVDRLWDERSGLS